ncbi:uncharacterized protein LOC117569407 [Drosophila albomicans]|uniref:Uncharacterized protein LOC117569407 n=1 Tax=Drosophila albomicans TaxID=7291 RepID=A0A6P8WXK7_DROAB|nr:uncharacterized protein LOC117569407 [Drosophila albomicans]
MTMPKNSVTHNTDQIALSYLLDKVHDDILVSTDSYHFRKPMKNNGVQKNIDLQTIGQNDYLQDIQKIVDNCVKCKGDDAKHTICARNMLEHARIKMKESEHFFIQLEANIVQHLKQAKANYWLRVRL